MTRIMIAGCLAAIAGIMGTVSATAQNDALANKQIIRVTGEAVNSATPDEVILEIGVMTQAATAQQAASENAGKLEKVLATLRSELGRDASIRTSNYSLNPEYVPIREGAQPEIRSYVATNMVQVRTGELAKIGRVIDAAIKAGANSIYRVEFTLRDRSQAMSAALREATTRARSKADAIAGGLGMRVVRVVSVEEGDFRGRYPMEAMNRMYDEAQSTQIEAGTVDVRTFVTLTVEVAPQ